MRRYREAEAPIGELRETVGTLGLGDPVIQRFGEANQVSIRVRLPESAEGDPAAANRISGQIIDTVTAEHPDFRVDSNNTVSGKVSGEFRETALYALLFAMLAMRFTMLRLALQALDFKKLAVQFGKLRLVMLVRQLA